MRKNKRYLFITATMVMAMLMPALASASRLTVASVRYGRLGINAGSGGASDGNDVFVTFKLNTTPTSVAKIIVTIPSGFTVTAGTPTPTTTNYPKTPANITVPPGTLTSSIVSAGAGLGGTITVSGLTSASLTGTNLYGFDIPAGYVTNPSAAGPFNSTIASANSSATPIDTTSYATYIYGSGANQDQDVVTGSVAPTFTFSLSANSDTIPTVNTTSIATSTGVNMLVGTNSPLGYTAYVKSANNALVSTTNPSTPISGGAFSGTAPNTITAGTTQYGFVPSTGAACSSCTGTLTYDAEYNGLTGTQAGGFNGTGFSSFVSRNGYTNNDTVLLQERDAVSTSVGYANDYTDTLTIVAAGNY